MTLQPLLKTCIPTHENLQCWVYISQKCALVVSEKKEYLSIKIIKPIYQEHCRYCPTQNDAPFMEDSRWNHHSSGSLWFKWIQQYEINLGLLILIQLKNLMIKLGMVIDFYNDIYFDLKRNFGDSLEMELIFFVLQNNWLYYFLKGSLVPWQKMLGEGCYLEEVILPLKTLEEDIDIFVISIMHLILKGDMLWTIDVKINVMTDWQL